MSINPVQKNEPAAGTQVAQPGNRSRLAEPNAGAARLAVPELGPSPKPKIHDPQNAAVSAEMPQDEVQVQRDSSTNGDIVIKYLDHSGEVVLQIPSSQVLGVARAIDEELALEAKARANAGETPSGSNGGNVHGH